MDFKPSNFFIGIVDFFSILLPGGILSVVLYIQFKSKVSAVFGIDDPEGNYAMAVLLLYAFLFGHLIREIGSLMDKPFYDRWIDKQDRPFLERIKEMRQQRLASSLGDLDWATYKVIQSEASIIGQINLQMANSKFFRSLVVISVFLAILFLIPREGGMNPSWYLLFPCMALGAFSMYSYFRLRKKASELTYKYTIFLVENALAEEKK